MKIDVAILIVIQEIINFVDNVDKNNIIDLITIVFDLIIDVSIIIIIVAQKYIIIFDITIYDISKIAQIIIEISFQIMNEKRFHR